MTTKRKDSFNDTLFSFRLWILEQLVTTKMHQEWVFIMGGAEFVGSFKILRLSIILITMYAAHFFSRHILHAGVLI